MALTNEEKQELLNAMKAESQGVDELEASRYLGRYYEPSCLTR